METTGVAGIPGSDVVRHAVNEAAKIIKGLILARISELVERGERFPVMKFATEHDHWVSSDEFGDHPVHKTGELPGIPLTSRGSWWDRARPFMVVLTPVGIFKYPYIAGDVGKPFPQFEKGVEDSRLWTQFGEYALSLLYPRPVTSEIKDRDAAGLVADVGQEYCRYCQYVASASEFRMAGRCPECGIDGWLAQYDVSVE